MDSLIDLIQGYDWREAFSLGIGATFGVSHAIYEHFNKKNDKHTQRLFLFSTSMMGIYLDIAKDPNFFRDIGNGLFSGTSYVTSYIFTRKFLENYVG